MQVIIVCGSVGCRPHFETVAREYMGAEGGGNYSATFFGFSRFRDLAHRGLRSSAKATGQCGKGMSCPGGRACTCKRCSEEGVNK
jgi:hypothetical protein